jgi:uncharacterized protein YqeY
MALIERIQKDLTEAMMSKDELRLSVLRMIKSALKYKEIEKVRPLDDAESMQVLQTLVKQRRESVDQFAKGGRQDLVEKETKEIAILENYLPAAPSDAELNEAIEVAIAETGATSPKSMGIVIKAAKARLEGKTVDGKVLSDRVKELLSRMI